MNKIIGTLFVVAAMTAAGCGGGDKKEGPATATGGTAPTTGGKKKGLDDPTNKPDVVAAVKKVLEACKDKWDAKGGFDSCSDPMSEFRQKKFEGGDATYMNLIEDDDAKVRYMGMVSMSNFGSYERRSNKELSTRLLTVLENEKPTSPIDAWLTYMVMDTNESTGLLDRIKDLGNKTTSYDVKAMLAGWWRNPRGYDLVKTLAASKDPKELHAASQGYAIQFEKHEAEACKFWADHFDDENAKLRESAVGHLTGGWSGNTTGDTEGSWYVSGGGGGPSQGSETAWCDPKQVDAAIATIEKRVKANTIDNSNYIYALGALAKHKKTTPAQKKKAVAALKKIVETKGAAQRSFALTKLGDIDVKDAKAFAKKFAKDDQLKWAVESVMKLEEKKEEKKK